MSEYELMNNEKLVDLFATFLHQALTSGEQYIRSQADAVGKKNE